MFVRVSVAVAVGMVVVIGVVGCHRTTRRVDMNIVRLFFFAVFVDGCDVVGRVGRLGWWQIKVEAGWIEKGVR